MNNCIVFPKNNSRGDDNMKKILLIAGCAAAFVFLVNAHIQALSPTDTAAPDTLPSMPSLSVENTPAEAPYLLKEFDKRVAAFASDQPEPLFVSEVYVSELPKADRLLLQDGIPVQSKTELTRLLEDYCS